MKTISATLSLLVVAVTTAGIGGPLPSSGQLTWVYPNPAVPKGNPAALVVLPTPPPPTGTPPGFLYVPQLPTLPVNVQVSAVVTGVWVRDPVTGGWKLVP